MHAAVALAQVRFQRGRHQAPHTAFRAVRSPVARRLRCAYGAGQRQLAGAVVALLLLRAAFDFPLLLKRIGRACQPGRVLRRGLRHVVRKPVLQARHLRRLRGHQVRHQPQVHRIDLGPAVGQRGGAQQADQLPPAPVGHDDPLARAKRPQCLQVRNDVGRQRHRVPLDQPRTQFFARDRRRRLSMRLRGSCTQGQQWRKRGIADRRDRHTHQEAVVKRHQRFVLRHFIGGAYHADQRCAGACRAVVELALVQQRQQRIQDRRVGLEHLVQKRDAGGGQVAVGEPLVAVVFERFQRQRAEQFFGRRKARQQPFEVPRPVERTVQPPRQFALGRAGRPDQQHMLAGQRTQQRQSNRSAAFEQTQLQRFNQRLQARTGRQGRVHE